MTLIVGLIAKDGIVITSDSRMTSGNASVSSTQANDTVRKIFRVNPHCGIAISGSGEIGVTLIEKFQSLSEKPENQTKNIMELSEMFRQLCMRSYSDWFQRLPPESSLIPSFNVLLCGYDKVEADEDSTPKIIRMSSIGQFAPMTTTTGYATLGLPTIANYLLNRLYIRDSMTKNQALSLAAYCIVETASQDGRVGGTLQAATFSNEDVFSELDERSIVKLTNRCDEVLRNSFQVSFYKDPPKEEPITAISEGEPTPETDAVPSKEIPPKPKKD